MKTSCPSQCRDESVIQDGVICPKTAPWGRHIGVLTTIPYIFIVIFAVIILARTSITAMVIWLLLLFAFAFPLRYLICARCPYYGQPCSTVLGMVTPKFFKKQENQSMILGLWLDVLFFSDLVFHSTTLCMARFRVVNSSSLDNNDRHRLPYPYPLRLRQVSVHLLSNRQGCTGRVGCKRQGCDLWVMHSYSKYSLYLSGNGVCVTIPVAFLYFPSSTILRKFLQVYEPKNLAT